MKRFSSIVLLAFLGLSNNLNAQNLNFLWAKQVSGVSIEHGSSVAVDANGNVYTTGSFYGAADFDPNSGTYVLTSVFSPSSGMYSEDIFVLKLSPSGNFIWAKRMGGSGHDTGNSIAVDANGNVYTTGSFIGTANFGTYTLTSNGGFVCKLDSSGNFLWAKQFSGSGSCQGNSIAVNAIGNVSITGNFHGTADFDPGTGTYNLTDPSGGAYSDIFVSTLDGSGNFLWAKQFGWVFDDEGNSIAVDAIGNIYTTGYKTGTVDFDPGSGTYNLGGDGRIFVSKLDANGSFIWAKELGTGDNTLMEGNSIAVDANGNVYTTGYFGSFAPADFDPGTGTYNLISAGDNDIFVSKLDPNGNFLWAKRFGGVSKDEGNSIAIGANGNVYTTGIFWGTVDFDPGPETHNLTSEGTFVSKLDPSGNFLLVGQLGGPVVSYSIAVDTNANIYTTGSFTGTADFDPNNGTYSLTSAPGLSGFSSADIFVEKLCQIVAPTITGMPSFCQGGSTTLTSSPANSYLWSNGATTQSISVTTSGNYSVTVSSASGCSASSTAVTVIGNPTPSTPNISIIGSATFCQGGSVTLTSSLATSYLWSNGATSQSITVSTAGQYSVTVSNASGCTAASSSVIPVTVLPLPTATITPDGPITFCQGGLVTLTASSASSYLWSNGATTQSITASNAGNYSVTVTGANGCTAASSATTVTLIPLPTATITPSGTISLCEGSSTTLTASTASSYLWSSGATTQSISVSNAGNYSVTVTGTNGCTAGSLATIVTVTPLPTATITPSGDTAFCQGGSVTLMANSASSYLWSNGATTQSITVSTAGNYSVTITSAGCTDASSPTTITVNPLPTVNLGTDITLQQGQQTILDATGPSLTYLWSTGATTPTITVNSMGTYSVTVTNGSGCTAIDAVVVTIVVSTADLDSKYKITVSPNPTQGTLNIRCEGSITTQVQIFDNLGRLVLEDNSFAPDAASRTLLLDKLPSGTFHLKIAGNEFVKIVSVVKN